MEFVMKITNTSSWKDKLLSVWSFKVTTCNIPNTTKKLCKHRVIISLDSLPQILHESVWNFYLQDKFMAFSLSFFALLKDLNKLYFCPAFQHFLLWPEPQLLNAILNLALWSWKLWWNYSIIHFKAGACVSCWWHPCDRLGYKAICGLRGQKCGLIFVVELTLAFFLAE